MKTILVVEDDNLTRKVIEIRVKQILGDVDIEIATATDGNEALEKYQALKPKVVILTWFCRESTALILWFK